MSQALARHFEGLHSDMSLPGAELARRWAGLDRTNAPVEQRTALWQEVAEHRYARTVGWGSFPRFLELWAKSTG
jgi:hypothetical protein